MRYVRDNYGSSKEQDALVAQMIFTVHRHQPCLVFRWKTWTECAFKAEAICEQMGRTPPWAEGLILRADGYETEIIRKIKSKTFR